MSRSNYIILGFTLFALFFGAGNLIFPAELGQYSGGNLYIAAFGFAITGVGLPLLGIMAIGFSNSNNLQALASRVHPVYGVLFTVMLYLTIGPFFAAPRTGAVAYEIGFAPFISETNLGLGLFIFTIVFFGITLWLSLNPAKLVDRIGKVLAPALVFLLAILLITVFFNPMSEIGEAQNDYVSAPFMTGFIEGYNTMDALASLVFGIIIINAVSSMGIKSRKGILSATAKAGLVAVFLLGAIYLGIAYLGATSTGVLGLFDTGGPVLSGAASHYFGTVGMILLAILITLACLTTSIGLMTACGEYFNTLIPGISYKVFVILFTLLTFVIANFGLAQIINYSLPVLMFLYPLAMAIIILAFASPLFKHKRFVYILTISVTFLVSIIDGIQTLCDTLEIKYFSWLNSIMTFYNSYLPLYAEGLGWFIPIMIILIISTIGIRIFDENEDVNN